jgi:hypothetical protein
MSECLCATRPGYDWDGNDIEVIYAYNTQCPVKHTDEELRHIQDVGHKSPDDPMWKAWYGA